MLPPAQDFQWVSYENPHLQRMRQILSRHPEIKQFCGSYPLTALYALFLVGLQLAAGIWISNQPWWIFLLVAYFVGGTVNHALYVIIHECTHHLVFKSSLLNRLLALFCNLPQFVPGAMPFFKYHMLHHSHQAEYDYDADLAGLREAAWVGNSRLKKAALIFWFGLVQGLLRPSRLEKVPFYDKWFVLNFILQAGFLVVVYLYFGLWPLAYFFLSTIFALGLHPLGGRWIQEHYVLQGGNQETYSYYGPLNKLCFNMGYHNEHHDFMRVPWPYLPKVKKIAAEYYESLIFYRSWLWVLWKFIFDPHITLQNRVARGSGKVGVYSVG